MSPIWQAPRTASIIACSKGSPSECPSVPRTDGIFNPPKKSFLPLTNLCTSNPIPIFKFDLLIFLNNAKSSLSVILKFPFSPFISLVLSLFINDNSFYVN